MNEKNSQGGKQGRSRSRTLAALEGAGTLQGTEELATVQVVEEGVRIPMRLHTYRFPSGLLLTLYVAPSGAVVMERVETPLKLRRQGLLRPTLARLLTACQEAEASLSLTILPDEEGNTELFRALARALESVGFRRDPREEEDPGAYLFLPTLQAASSLSPGLSAERSRAR